MLEARDLQVRYGDQVVLNLDGIKFSHGNTYAVIGANGAGKSTLLLCLAGLIKPTHGKILLNKKDITGTAMPSIGVLLQKTFLFSGSVLRNVEYGLRCQGISKSERRHRALAALAKVDMKSMAHKTRRTLSGGEMQRVVLARILALEPEILLLDEPFAHLDQECSATLLHILRGMNEHKRSTTVIATHDFARGYALADIVIALESGKRVKPRTMNILRGISRRIEGQSILETGDGLRIQHMEPVLGESAFHVDPSAITLARRRYISTARNQLKGKITALIQEGTGIRAEVAVSGYEFSIMLTQQSCRDLILQVGEEIWLVFKASAVKNIEL